MKFLLSLLMLFIFAEAKASIVKCTSEIEGKKEAVSFKLNENNKIVTWDETRMGFAKKGSFFEIFSEDLNEGGIEYSHIIIARNGYTLIQVGTTADEQTIGIAPDRSRGFYKYKDMGSGNGNFEYDLNCNIK